MSPLYREDQKFNQWWVWLIMLATMFVGIYAGVQTYLESGNLVALLVGGGISAGVAILFAMMTLRTTVTSEGIEVAFRPFHRRRIFRSEIQEAYVREYNALTEYGGWGVRGGSNGKAFNVSGNQGLQLKLKNGESILIGTQHPEALKAAIAGYLNTDNEEDEYEGLELEEIRTKQPIRRKR